MITIHSIRDSKFFRVDTIKYGEMCATLQKYRTGELKREVKSKRTKQ